MGVDGPTRSRQAPLIAATTWPEVTVPTAETLVWAIRSVSPRARLRSAGPFSERSSSWRLDLAGTDVPTVVLRAGDPTDHVAKQCFAAEAAALRVAAGGPAPRLIASDVTGAEASQLAIVSCFLEGSTLDPRTIDDERLRSLGHAVALLAGIDPGDTDELPACRRPLHVVDFSGLRAAGDSTPLLDEAEQAIAAVTVPPQRDVLVHGDCWQGNTMWRGDTFIGLIDWESAGRGPAGIDLGYLRMDVAVHFAPERVDAVLDGWFDAGRSPLPDLAYWDVVGALCTPTDLRVWVPTLTARGRADLDADTVTARRDPSPTHWHDCRSRAPE